jgi:hypothetical protein
MQAGRPVPAWDVALLERIAAYRQTWGVRSEDPLGVMPRNLTQLSQYRQLAADLGNQRQTDPATHARATETVDDDRVPSPEAAIETDLQLGLDW